MKLIRRLDFKLFKRYQYFARGCYYTYHEADEMIRVSAQKPESEQWVIDEYYEDRNRVPGVVFLCRRERIRE